MFPFGHGLSYTTFKYDNLTLSKKQVSGDEKLTVSVDIKNTGDRIGKEVVQLYVQDLESSIDRPLKELKGFKKVEIEPGKIVAGQIEKFFKDSCLMSQEYVRDPKITIAELVTDIIAKMGENIKINKFARFQIGA